MAYLAKETAEAVRLPRCALEIAKDDAFVLSASDFLMGSFLTGISLMERALQLNANDADGWRWSGWPRIYCGEQHEAA